MASPISCLSILVIPLLLTSLFYHVSNADQALVESICNEMRDKNFCLSELLSNPQSISSNLSMLGIITIDLNLKVFEEAEGQISKILGTLKDPLDQSRLTNCKTNLANARETIKTARNATQGQSKEQNLIMDAFVKINNCDSAYWKPPNRPNPIDKLTNKIVELFNISNQIIAMIG